MPAKRKAPEKRSHRPKKPTTRPRGPAPTPPPGPKRRPRRLVQVPESLIIRAPVGLLPPAPSDVTANLPAAGALMLPEQPIIALTGLSQLDTTAKERKALMADFPPDQVDIKPTGECYVAHIHLRRQLSVVLGPGAWGMQPMGKPTVHEGQWMVMAWALFIRGKAVSWTWGGARYQANNPRASWSDALETTKSDALARLCKDIPMAGQCWDRRHNDRFKREQCVLVYDNTNDGTKLHWRTLDREPFLGEQGIHPDSPNADKYQGRQAPPAGGGTTPPAGSGAAPRAGSTSATGARLISDLQVKRLLKIANSIGWKKHELLRFLREDCKLKPAEGKADDLWHLCAAITRSRYDQIINDIQTATA
ncbi:hypothetical protein LCGC14_1669180 [marine sediment metagenome]|uniref:Uncharacterized protein n=1 Tax=marine sediment metagenome TaxID=412755 RepID=A0A0F9HSQ7_9ZZZZ